MHEYVIFAAQPYETHEVMRELESKNIEFKVLLGSYKSELETAFIVPYKDLLTVIEAGFLAEQESILMLGPKDNDGSRPCLLRYINCDPLREEYIGPLQQISKDYAHTLDGWFFDPTESRYYSALISEALKGGE